MQHVVHAAIKIITTIIFLNSRIRPKEIIITVVITIIIIIIILLLYVANHSPVDGVQVVINWFVSPRHFATQRRQLPNCHHCSNV